MRVTKTLVRWPCHSRTYSSILKTVVRWPYHPRTYSSIFKLWCGGRTTHAHILPFSNSGAVAVPPTHIFFHFKNSAAVAVPPTHIFFHFQTLVRWPYHPRTYSSILKTLVRWPYHSRTYSSIFKLWCGGCATHAHILPFSNSGAVAVPLTHIFFHFQTLV